MKTLVNKALLIAAAAKFVVAENDTMAQNRNRNKRNGGNSNSNSSKENNAQNHSFKNLDGKLDLHHVRKKKSPIDIRKSFN